MTKRIWAIIGAVVVVCAAIALIFHLWQKSRNEAAQGRLDRGQAEAGVNAGSDAIATIGNVTATEANILDTVKEGQDEIDRAPAGNSNAAADRATCSLRYYRDTPGCAALRSAGSAPVSR
jgi:hypothetical protein